MDSFQELILYVVVHADTHEVLYNDAATDEGIDCGYYTEHGDAHGQTFDQTIAEFNKDFAPHYKAIVAKLLPMPHDMNKGIW